jgi:hypothetical protein
VIVLLRVHLPGAAECEIGDEIWQQSLADAIAAEAQTIADHAGPELLPSPDQELRDALRDQIIHAMTRALVGVGDEYQAPDGVRYSLVEKSAPNPGSLPAVSSIVGDPVVEEVLQFENLPLGSAGSRSALVRWSDGSESVAVTFYADEILFSEGDLLGKTRAQIQSLHFKRDRDWLQS